jgi:hypothetical protein
VRNGADKSWLNKLVLVEVQRAAISVPIRNTELINDRIVEVPNISAIGRQGVLRLERVGAVLSRSYRNWHEIEGR